jgi:hypothetical protein
MKSIRDHVIWWTPGGSAELFPFPPPPRARAAGYTMDAGASCIWVRTASTQELQQHVKALALALIIRDGVDPQVVHRCMWELKEYRDSTPEDMPEPRT